MKDIDYEAMYNRLVDENEELHRQVTRLRNASAGYGLNLKQVAEKSITFVEHHYVFCVFALLLTSAAVSGAYRIWADGRRLHE